MQLRRLTKVKVFAASQAILKEIAQAKVSTNVVHRLSQTMTANMNQSLPMERIIKCLLSARTLPTKNSVELVRTLETLT
tara:strand:- start:1735 stop:1971 length:237 start_codon:yes stop_codon:yes gene_type:complete